METVFKNKGSRLSVEGNNQNSWVLDSEIYRHCRKLQIIVEINLICL